MFLLWQMNLRNEEFLNWLSASLIGIRCFIIGRSQKPALIHSISIVSTMADEPHKRGIPELIISIFNRKWVFHHRKITETSFNTFHQYCFYLERQMNLRNEEFLNWLSASLIGIRCFIIGRSQKPALIHSISIVTTMADEPQKRGIPELIISIFNRN